MALPHDFCGSIPTKNSLKIYEWLRPTRTLIPTAALREIDLGLQHHGRTNEIVGLPAVIHLDTEYLRFKHMFDPAQMRAYVAEHLPNLTAEQRSVYDKVVASVTTERPPTDASNVFMIDAPAGTGKTYTEGIICAHLRSTTKLVLCVASTGIIAGLQLPGG